MFNLEAHRFEILRPTHCTVWGATLWEAVVPHPTDEIPRPTHCRVWGATVWESTMLHPTDLRSCDPLTAQTGGYWCRRKSRPVKTKVAQTMRTFVCALASGGSRPGEANRMIPLRTLTHAAVSTRQAKREKAACLRHPQKLLAQERNESKNPNEPMGIHRFLCGCGLFWFI